MDTPPPAEMALWAADALLRRTLENASENIVAMAKELHTISYSHDGRLAEIAGFIKRINVEIARIEMTQEYHASLQPPKETGA